MSLNRGFHMIITVIVSNGDTSSMCRSRSQTVTIIWKPGLTTPTIIKSLIIKVSINITKLSEAWSLNNNNNNKASQYSQKGTFQ